jgi:SulP family sulfate permease
VTVGFTGGIATVILASQLKDLLGLTLGGPEPGPLPEKVVALGAALPTLNAAALGLGLAVAVAIMAFRRHAPRLPGMLIAVAAASFAALCLGLPVETIADRFGGIVGGLPAPALPALSLDKVRAVLPAAAAFTLLGGIESLLSAVVADGMTGRRHRSNLELVAQGVANVGSSLFGGISVTGAIARTATNVRAGARGPISGMLHSLFLLAFLAIAAPLAGYIPLSALAGVLVVVAWNMAEREHIARLLRRLDGAIVFLATFLLTVVHDLTAGIVAGCLAAALLAYARRRKA